MSDGHYTTDWFIFRHADPEKQDISRRPPPPPWRDFQHPERRTYYQFELEPEEIAVVNAALYLRRPLLITGPPGSGKSSLAYAVAHELKLGNVLKWPITSRATVEDAKYRYDAIGRLQAQRQVDYEREQGLRPDGDGRVPIGRFLQLGPLGTAFADSVSQPRVLLIDEIDKSDIDLPNDLLNLFEEGTFEITELARLAPDKEPHDEHADDEPNLVVDVRLHDSRRTLPVTNGVVTCAHFPVIIMTSNGERELPGPFLRRCLRIDIDAPSAEKLERVVAAHFLKPLSQLPDEVVPKLNAYIKALAAELQDRREKENEFVATDQLLNAIFLRLHDADGLTVDQLEEVLALPRGDQERTVIDFVLQAISRTSQL